MTTDREERAARAVERACADAASVVDLCRRVHAEISVVVPTDRWCGFAVDPATMFATNGYHDEGFDAALVGRLLEIEHGEEDFNLLPALARSAEGVATISRASDGDPARSARWRDVIVPSGLAHEMRAVFRDKGAAWGALVLLRGPDTADFTDRDGAFVRRVAPTVAVGFRRALVRQHLGYGDDARDSGILVLGGERLDVRTTTAAARQWLAELDDSGHGGPLPTAVIGAAHAARADRSSAATARARTRAGRWVTIVAETMTGSDDIGVVMQPSGPAEIARIVAAAHGLTPRETDVVLLVASGATNQEIARSLGVSRYTVVDHLKNVFAKLDVATRGELTSKLFFDHYLPRASDGRPAGSDGWFLPD